MRDLLLVVPSRGRPQNIARLWEAMQATCTGDTTLIVGLDDDDPTAGQYPDGPQYKVRSGLRQVVAWINELAIPQVGNYRYIGHIGDDNVPESDGWDTAIMDALERTPFAFANDLYPRAPGSLCCHVFTRSGVIQRLGYFGPPSIRHMYVDVAWMAWGVKTGITYLHEVLIPHKHYTVGAPIDASYQASTGLIPTDLEAWHAYCRAGQLNADIAKIDPAADGFTEGELQQFNVGLNIPVHWGVPGMIIPTVSVITPTWQRHGYLFERCIPSVQAQDYPAVEHIVVCDGPDPELAGLIAGQVDVFMQMPDHDPGVQYGSRARRAGLELATGEFITYLDDDDAYRPNHCSILAAALEADPLLDFAYSKMSSEGALVGADPPVFCGIGTPMIMHRRETLRFGTWGPDGPAEDWDLVERWLAGGARYAHVTDVTVDVWPSGYRR